MALKELASGVRLELAQIQDERAFAGATSTSTSASTSASAAQTLTPKSERMGDMRAKKLARMLRHRPGRVMSTAEEVCLLLALRGGYLDQVAEAEVEATWGKVWGELRARVGTGLAGLDKAPGVLTAEIKRDVAAALGDILGPA